MARIRRTTHVGFWVHIGNTQIHKHVVGEVLNESSEDWLVKSTELGNYYIVNKSDKHGKLIDWKSGDF